MQLMETCFDKLKNNYGPIPERILGKMTVAVSLIISVMHQSSRLLDRMRQLIGKNQCFLKTDSTNDQCCTVGQKTEKPETIRKKTV
jgi:N-acetylglucosamine-6-phosphate deacetylase